MSEYPDPTKNACPTFERHSDWNLVPDNMVRAWIPIPSGMNVKYVMPKLEVQLLHPDAKLPTRGSEHAAGLDLFAHTVTQYGSTMLQIGTGIAVAIPEGYTGFLFPRSSITATSMRLANSVGAVDCDYRGELILRFDDMNLPDSDRNYHIGDRVGQLIILATPRFQPIQVDTLPETARGNGGFGSSGK